MNWRRILGFTHEEAVTLAQAQMMYRARLYTRFPEPNDAQRIARLAKAMAEAEQELA